MKLLLGDCLDKLKELDENSIDSVVTDPPYELGFMGKKWDSTGIAYNPDLWKEVYRVLKPGGHLLSFGGSRTYHRMAVAIEDAGFEIRDQIMWVYGCLTEDTEILTKEGWKHYHKITKDDIYSKEEILVYDTENDIYKWERPQRWYVYPVNEDTIYRIRGNQTDQLVSRDHNCLVERDGELTFVKSQDLGDMERMPILSNDFSFLQKGELQVLQLPMQRNGERKGMEKARIQRSFGLDRGESQELSNKNEWREQPGLERRNNLQKQEGVLLKSKNKIREVSRRIQKYGKERWIRNGIQVESSTGIEETFVENGMCTSYRPQSRKQRYTKSNAIQEQLRPQEIRSGTSYTTDMATITKETYSGIIFCPNTSTGAFVARRNGKVFITGNSGFPKSHNIGKGVDKKLGNKREVVGHNPNHREHNNNMKEMLSLNNPITTKGNSEWEGWGTALKPAHEPIVMARKPLSEKTVVDNVLEWGTGGINIDDSRIDGGERDARENNTSWGISRIGEETDIKGNKAVGKTTLGRFPANLIFDEEAGKILDEQSGTSKSTGGRIEKKTGWGEFGGSGQKEIIDGQPGFGDTGGASRFFYCPKTSKTDRNEGLDGFEEKKSRKWRDDKGMKLTGSGNPRNEMSKNFHPTVKPTDLMLYLIRLVTPKGGTTLDPFMGSGSTGKGAVRGGFNFIGIEREKEYFEIAKARIDYEQKNPYIEEKGIRVETNENSQKFW